MSALIAIITILTSGVVAGIVTYRLNTNKEHVFFMRRKAEELYLAAERYDKGLTGRLALNLPVLQGELTYDQLNDFILKQQGTEEMGRSHEQMLMLVRIYFPAIERLLEDYLGARDKVNDIVTFHKRKYKRGVSDTKSLEKFMTALRELDRAAEAFKSAIVAEAQGFSGIETLWPKWRRYAQDQKRKLPAAAALVEPNLEKTDIPSEAESKP